MNSYTPEPNATNSLPATPGVVCSDLLCVWKEQYPVIKTLGHGWHLVAHPNGPAIARAENWQYLGHLANHWTNKAQDDVPPAIRYDAVEALMNWAVKQPAWPTHNKKTERQPGSRCSQPTE